MPDFLNAFHKTMGHEGGWSNHPADRGGETIMGISRVHHPEWEGWSLLDTLKNDQGIPNLRQPDALPLVSLVEDFYQAEYWSRTWCDKLPSQELAEEVFDSAVHCGVKTTVFWVQEAVNLLRHREDVAVVMDGVMGERTLSAVRMTVARQKLPKLVKLLNVIQGAHYLEIARRDPNQRQFLVGGWLNRLIF